MFLAAVLAFGCLATSAFASDAESGPQAVIDAPEAQPEQQPDVTEEPAPEATEEPAPEATEEPAPEVTEESAPEVTAEPAPEATEEPAPEATAEPAPEATEEPAPEATAEPAPEEPTDEPETAAVSSAVTYYDPSTGAEKTARNVTRVTADVNLILSHGTILTVSGGITIADGGSLTIWGSDRNYNDDGELTVTGADRYCAGIGTGGEAPMSRSPSAAAR